jgi:hypothetical protein
LLAAAGATPHAPHGRTAQLHVRNAQAAEIPQRKPAEKTALVSNDFDLGRA